MQEQTNNVITIVLTADNHLGYTVPGQHPRKREEQRQRQRHAFSQATDFAVGQGVDLFLQAGDLFDTPHPDEQDRSFVAARLAQLKQAAIRVFALGGVHDTPTETHSLLGDATAPAPQLSYASLGALHYFPPVSPTERRDHAADDEGHVLRPEMLDIRGIQVGICGLGVTPGQQGDPLAQARVDDDIERAAIPLLLLHAPIEDIASGASVLDTQAQVSR
ncbi:MAG TPA: metallophosphoesterase, partial [Ktedonobacteraceae bacterium]|nr:metallophosphoesterase [Ktedonobacteraceae bacterium]